MELVNLSFEQHTFSVHNQIALHYLSSIHKNEDKIHDFSRPGKSVLNKVHGIF